MNQPMNRRQFLKTSAAMSGAAALAAGTPAGAEETNDADAAGSGMPTGKIGDMEVSRLISGGNLISGWAHSRDLDYVSSLMTHYNTPDKVLETLKVMEEHGINAIIADLRGIKLKLLQRYWNEMGGNIRWIHQAHASPDRPEWDIKRAVDNGASAAYIHGGVADRLVRKGRPDFLGKSLELIKKQGVPGGIGAHNLDVIIASETAGYEPNFYMKTLHHHDYWSSGEPRNMPEVIDNTERDNYWARRPKETIQFMQEVETPWIAYKVLAAGAIRPEDGFRYAFQNGADFICVGMFDWQVAEDVHVMRETMSEVRRNGRERPWRT